MPPLIRLATPDDAEQVHAVYAPYCHTPISFEAVPPGPDEMRRRMVQVLENHPWLVCEKDGEIVGYAYAGRHGECAAYRWSVDTSVYIGQQHRRLGLGRALYTSLLGMLSLQGYVNAYAGVTLPNAASVGLHEAMGFQPVGVYRQVGFKYGTWHDVGWYQRLHQPMPLHPELPRPLKDVRQTAAWVSALAAGQPVLRP